MHNNFGKKNETIGGTSIPKTNDKKSTQLPYFKHSNEINHHFENIKKISHEFNHNRFNNYDNVVRNASRELLEKYEIYKTFDKRPAPMRDPSPNDNKISLGSCYGAGGRVFLYSSSPKINKEVAFKPTNSNR